MSKLLVEKYQPLRLDDLSYNKHIDSILQKLATQTNFSHLIFYGQDGAGKKTRIRVLLQLMFNENVHKLRIEHKEMKINSTKVEYNIATSPYHIELTPSDSKNHDRHIIQYVIKEVASTKNIQLQNNVKSSKIIVIHEADNLSREAQSSLRRTMEKYIGNCRLIMTCTQLSKILPPIRSRCLAIRVPSPTTSDISKILRDIRHLEEFEVNENQLSAIVSSCNRNLREAIFNLQISKYIFIKQQRKNS